MLIQEIADGRRDAVHKCINIYGGAIWAFAKSQTKNELEAEAAVHEIFIKVWKCSCRYLSSELSESECIDLICRQWLMNYLQVR